MSSQPKRSETFFAASPVLCNSDGERQWWAWDAAREAERCGNAGFRPDRWSQGSRGWPVGHWPLNSRGPEGVAQVPAAALLRALKMEVGREGEERCEAVWKRYWPSSSGEDGDKGPLEGLWMTLWFCTGLRRC